MESKPQHVKRLRAELGTIGGEISKKIDLLDKLSSGIKQGHDELGKAISGTLAWPESKLTESSGDVKEIQRIGEELQVLLDKQLSLQTELHGLLMSGDAFYNPVMGTFKSMVE